MRKINWLLLLLISTGSFAQLSVTKLQTENQSFPFGIDVLQPRFSWQLNSPVRNTMQTADGQNQQWPIRFYSLRRNHAGKQSAL